MDNDRAMIVLMHAVYKREFHKSQNAGLLRHCVMKSFFFCASIYRGNCYSHGGEQKLPIYDADTILFAVTCSCVARGFMTFAGLVLSVEMKNV